MTSTPGGKIAGGIFGGIIGITILYIVNKRFDFSKAQVKSIAQTKINYTIPVPIGNLPIHQPEFDNELITDILTKNLTLKQYITSHIQKFIPTYDNVTNNLTYEKSHFSYMKIANAVEKYTKHKAEANRIQEAELAAEKARRNQKAKKAAELAAAEAKRNQEAKEAAKRNQEVKEKAKRIQKIVSGIQLPEYLREAEQSNINREQLIREFATYATIYKDERAAAEAKRIQEAEKLKEVPKHNNVVQNDMVPFEQNTTNDGDDEFFNALPPNNNKIITGSSKKSKKHKRRTRRRTKKN